MTLGTAPRLPIPQNRLAGFCRRHHIRRLALFGSVLRADFRPTSDVDVLVTFDPAHVPGFLRLFELEQELADLLGGRKVDLVTEKFLSPRIRSAVLAAASVQYAEE